MRHFWGTTPARRLSGTTTPHATTSTSSVWQHASMAGATPVTRHCTHYVALHPLRGATPLTRRCTRYEALHPLRGTAPITRHYTPYVAPHPLRGSAPLTRHHTRYGAVHPIRRGVMPTDRVQRPQSQEQTRNLRDAGQAAVPVGGGGAWPGNAQTTSPTDWRPPRGLRGLAGQRVDAPSEARGADGERAGRRPQAHQAARPDEQHAAARLHRDRAAHTSGDSCQKPQLSRRSRWRHHGRPRR